MQNYKDFKRLLKETGFEFRQTNFGTALFRDGKPVPHTVDKDIKYLNGFMHGYLMAEFEFNFANILKVCKLDENHKYTAYWYPDQLHKKYNCIHNGMACCKYYEIEITLNENFLYTKPTFEIKLYTKFINKLGIIDYKCGRSIIVTPKSMCVLNNSHCDYIDLYYNVPSDFDIKFIPKINSLIKSMVSYLKT